MEILTKRSQEKLRWWSGEGGLLPAASRRNLGDIAEPDAAGRFDRLFETASSRAYFSGYRNALLNGALVALQLEH